MTRPRDATRVALLALLAATAACLALLLLPTCGDRPDECEVARVEADPSSQSPRPSEDEASFYFAGNNPFQREFVFLHEDGHYDYVERWNFGVPQKDTFLQLDVRSRVASWLPQLDLAANVEQGESGPDDDKGVMRFDIDWDDELQASFGFDWKVGCRMHVCRRESGVCCHQHCKDGGATGAAYEPPDQFDCMNSSAGGRYDWFLEGLRSGGMTALSACNE